MFAQFKNNLKTKQSFLTKGKLLLACSGGLDSSVLAHLCVRSNLSITLAHCNFNLRGEASDGDETFVKQLALELGIPSIIKSFDTQNYIQNYGGSVQMGARALRYEWFESLIETEGFDYVLTAHHADDNLETFLINLSRGTGIDGLTGIPVNNQGIVRPLLGFTRSQILDYAESEGIAWREDCSNKDTKYLRNKVRHEVVPSLKELHPAFLDNFSKTQIHLNQVSSIVENHINGIKKGLFEKKEGRTIIKIEQLSKLTPLEAYLYQLFNEYGFTDWTSVKELLNANSGKEVMSKSHTLLKDREYLILSEQQNVEPSFFTIEKDISQITVPINLKFEQAEFIGDGSKNVVFLDKEKLNYPLILRNWEKGDYFYPFGMQGKKKLSKFFKDEKIDVLSKKNQWLLCSDNNIIWVVGKRLDERFKVDSSTKNILKVTLSI